MTEISLIYGNVNESDILVKDELDRLAKEHSRFKVFYVLDKPPSGWKGGEGFVTADMIKEHLPEPAPKHKILVCVCFNAKWPCAHGNPAAAPLRWSRAWSRT